MAKPFKSFLNESVSYTYSIPSDIEKQLYDFYIMSLLYDVVEKGFPDYKVMNSHLDDSSIKDLEQIPIEALPKILAKQKPALLRATLHAIISESKWVLDLNSYEEIEKYAKSYGVVNECKKFFGELKYHHQTGFRLLEHDLPTLIKMFQSSSWKPSKFVKFCEQLFDGIKNIGWGHHFGGKAWGNIARAWQYLDRASTIKDISHAIDYIYSLEHNTGTMFNKVKEFAKNGDYSWIKIALDLKYTADPIHITAKSSIPKNILGMYSRLANISIFKSYEQFSNAKIVVQDIKSKMRGNSGVRLYGYETDDPDDGLPGKTPTGYEKFFPKGKTQIVPLDMVDSKSKIDNDVNITNTVVKNSIVRGRSALINSQIYYCSIELSTVYKSELSNIMVSPYSQIGDSIIIGDGIGWMKINEGIISKSKLTFNNKQNHELKSTGMHNSTVVNSSIFNSEISRTNITNSRIENIDSENSTFKDCDFISDDIIFDLSCSQCKFSNIYYRFISPEQFPKNEVKLRGLTITNTFDFIKAIGNQSTWK